MASTGCSSFSDDGSYYAYCSPDGKLRIWDTSSNTLKQEYTPNLHLSDPFTCICWIPSSKNGSKSSSVPKKSRKSNVGVENEDAEAKYQGSGGSLLVLGTESGNIILYCVASGSSIGQLKEGHKKKVNGFSFSARRNSLFSCGEDKLVVEWKVKERSVQNVWKAGKRPLTSVLDLQDGESVLVASSTITWWDVDNKEVLKTFTGHASSISYLRYLPPISNLGKSYFLSASKQERVINVWMLDYDSPTENSFLSFGLKNFPENIAVGIPTEKATSTNLAVVTASGILQIFHHELDGAFSAKPVKASLTVDVNAGESDIQILDVHLGNDGNALIVHGSNYNMVTFEKISTKANESHIHLDRQTKKLPPKDSSETKVKAPDVSEANYLSVVQSGSGPVSSHKKRMEGKIAEAQLPMDERLNNLALLASNSSSGATKTPMGEHSAQLLLQGLHSKDKKILFNVFINKDEKSIRNTLIRLPVTAIMPLVGELTKIIQRKGFIAKAGVQWLRMLLMIHGAHLVASGSDELAALMEFVDSRLILLPHIHRLKGRVGMLLGQGASLAEPIQEAKLVLCDESSDEDSVVNNIKAYSSDSGDNWEESEEDDDVDSNGKEDSDMDEKDIMEEGDG